MQLIHVPTDLIGRGRSSKLWRNVNDLDMLSLALAGDGYAIWDDFLNFSAAATPYNWLIQTASSGLVNQYGINVQNGGKGGVADFYTPATNGAIAAIQSGGGYGPFYWDFLAQKYQAAVPLVTAAPNVGQPQCASYANDLVFEARVALPMATTSTPIMPTSSPVSATLDGHQLFVGLAANGAIGSAANLISSAGVFAPAQDCIGFYIVGGAAGVTNGLLNFGWQTGSTNPQTLTNITVATPGGAALSPFVNAYNAAITAQTAATGAGAAANQAAEIGLDYLWVNLGFRFDSISQTVTIYVNGYPVAGAYIGQTSSSGYVAGTSTQAFPNSPTSTLPGTTTTLHGLPTSYLAPTILSKEYNSASAVAEHLLVDWIGCAQTN